MNTYYKDKYFKYKDKYLNLKGGSEQNLIEYRKLKEDYQNASPREKELILEKLLILNRLELPLGVIHKTAYYKLKIPFRSNQSLKEAINLWINNREECLFRYDHISLWVTDRITEMSNLFRNCEQFNDNIQNWNTKNVINMESMFENCKEFNQDIGNWNISKVKNTNRMFYNCKKFNQNLNTKQINTYGLSYIAWNTSNIESMSYMFNGCNIFNGNINNWNISKVRDLSGIFSMCHNFNQDIRTKKININRIRKKYDAWNVRNVVNMEKTFFFCTNFNQNIGNWDTRNVVNMKKMFTLASNFNQNIGNWNVSNVTDMTMMFGFASNFNQDINTKDLFLEDGRHTYKAWDTTNLKYAGFIFYGAENIICYRNHVFRYPSWYQFFIDEKEYDRGFPNMFIDDDKDYTLPSDYLRLTHHLYYDERSIYYDAFHDIHDDEAMDYLLMDDNFYEFNRSFLTRSNYINYMRENFLI